MKKRTISVSTAVILMLLAVVTSVIITTMASAERYNQRLGNLNDLENKYSRLKEVSDIVEKYFVGEYDENKAMDEALAGYIYGLGDRWSGYYNTEQTKEINEVSSNSYYGIGATVLRNDNGEYEIASINKNGGAYKEGLVIKDIITSVDGVPSYTFASTDDLVAAVRGEEGTSVVIGYRRAGSEGEVTVTRSKIYNESIEARIIGNNVGYVVIDNFETNADKEFIEKVRDLEKKGVKAFIFDVRFNGGGYVTVMKNMLDILLPEGTVISMVDKAGKRSELKSDAAAIELPMVVITNEYSISAAEFFAAALQEYGVAKVVGDPTGGKGYSQNLFTLRDGSSVNLSTSRYYTPKGESLIDRGVTPDVAVSLSDEDFINFYTLTDAQDTQLQTALNTVDKMAK